MLSCKIDYTYEVEVLPLEQPMYTTYWQNPYSTVAEKICNPWMKILSMVKDVKEYVASTSYSGNSKEIIHITADARGLSTAMGKSRIHSSLY